MTWKVSDVDVYSRATQYTLDLGVLGSLCVEQLTPGWSFMFVGVHGNRIFVNWPAAYRMAISSSWPDDPDQSYWTTPEEAQQAAKVWLEEVLETAFYQLNPP